MRMSYMTSLRIEKKLTESAEGNFLVRGWSWKADICSVTFDVIEGAGEKIRSSIVIESLGEYNLTGGN